jgi:hypothetical protein
MGSLLALLAMIVVIVGSLAGSAWLSGQLKPTGWYQHLRRIRRTGDDSN